VVQKEKGEEKEGCRNASITKPKIVKKQKMKFVSVNCPNDAGPNDADHVLSPLFVSFLFKTAVLLLLLLAALPPPSHRRALAPTSTPPPRLLR